jgi:hypothetical protein
MVAGDLYLPNAATTDACRPYPRTRHFAVTLIIVTPPEATSTVEAYIASHVEVEAVSMVVGAGRFHHQLEVPAAGGICRRPLRFKGGSLQVMLDGRITDERPGKALRGPNAYRYE